uniref:Uncharacterized protein n=1 Tax=Chromera velia CCMP2878 TaxID=1169474 RepID=A0A0G4I8I2_9ALVE|eukprot:Cvel_11968.t1-p1 / transcript=Cvel_11968.t1 / gene=Cvel_11968 / organism=Chromera_velia_CCMP2878 / gene_product=hypothetical protein / transcript_product=hypothetical protein / location=Cvel_scaffold767:18057-19946(+) / protein_length=81 / sequence_SO=supercontig / SO=protein_coding / is_pseudo=false
MRVDQMWGGRPLSVSWNSGVEGRILLSCVLVRTHRISKPRQGGTRSSTLPGPGSGNPSRRTGDGTLPYPVNEWPALPAEDA